MTKRPEKLLSKPRKFSGSTAYTGAGEDDGGYGAATSGAYSGAYSGAGADSGDSGFGGFSGFGGQNGFSYFPG